MPPTPVPASTRFFAPEISKCLFMPTKAAATATLLELNASTDLTSEIADLAGWDVSSGEINTPDLGSRFDSKIPGRTSVSASTLTMYSDRDGDDVRTVLPAGTEGYIVFADHGITAALPYDEFPVRVSSVAKMRTVGDESARLLISFTVTSKPVADVPWPAA